MRHIIKLFLLFYFSISFKSYSQEQKPFWLGVHGSRSFASSGDNVGLMGSVFLEKQTKKNRILGLEVSFNTHAETAVRIFASETGNPADAFDMSYRRVMSGAQLGAYAGKQFKIANKHFLRTDIGSFIRVQFNSNNRIGVYYPIRTSLPFPVIAFDNRFGAKARTFSVGLKAAFQYQYQLNAKWRIGLHGSIQTDTQGDNFYNYGLTAATRFLR